MDFREFWFCKFLVYLIREEREIVDVVSGVVAGTCVNGNRRDKYHRSWVVSLVFGDPVKRRGRRREGYVIFVDLSDMET